jgi:ArsR family transcriptional regulator, lead/cadmium/zinc/bismuth-responsive transcriptional repressor
MLETDNDNAVAQLADLFHLLGDPTRLRIVLSCLPSPIAVGDIAGSLDLSS